MFPFLPPPQSPESNAEPTRKPSPRPRPRREQPPEFLPREWRPCLKANVAHYRLLRKAERRRFRDDVAEFIAGKDWEGCRGLTVTDEMCVTVAAQACLMLLGREHDCFGRVRCILLYPSAFRIKDERWEEAGFDPFAAAGQAVHAGPVILSWDAVLAQGRDPSAGGNLVIHEFAHQLDFIDGYADGTLDLLGEDAQRWQDVLAAEYHRLCRDLRRGHETFLGDYAATNKTEFFATASERFFTQPAKLRHYHPELYKMLRLAYGVDPRRWFARMRQSSGRALRYRLGRPAGFAALIPRLGAAGTLRAAQHDPARRRQDQQHAHQLAGVGDVAAQRHVQHQDEDHLGQADHRHPRRRRR